MEPLTEEALLFEVRAWQRTHPQAIVKSPAETVSRQWEVSLPKSATIAFDEPRIMLQCLSMISIPEDDDQDDDPAPRP